MGTDSTTTAAPERVTIDRLRVGREVRFHHDPSLLGRRFKVSSVQTSALHPGTVLVSATDLDRRGVHITMRLPKTTTAQLVTA